MATLPMTREQGVEKGEQAARPDVVGIRCVRGLSSRRAASQINKDPPWPPLYEGGEGVLPELGASRINKDPPWPPLRRGGSCIVDPVPTNSVPCRTLRKGGEAVLPGRGASPRF